LNGLFSGKIGDFLKSSRPERQSSAAAFSIYRFQFSFYDSAPQPAHETEKHSAPNPMKSTLPLLLITALALVARADEKSVALFNGGDLSGWHADVPAADTNAAIAPSFLVRDGKLVSLGDPRGHLITDQSFSNYRLDVEYRFPGKPGNCGVLVHSSKPRALDNMFPQSIEVQMQSGNAGDFWCIHENIEVPDQEKRRPHKPGQPFGGGPKDARRILNLTDDSEKPAGGWNHMSIECAGREIKVQVNGTLVNHGSNATTDKGQIALQAEGTEVEFRKVELTPLPPPAK
jgi:hypothetical protein